MGLTRIEYGLRRLIDAGRRAGRRHNERKREVHGARRAREVALHAPSKRPDPGHERCGLQIAGEPQWRVGPQDELVASDHIRIVVAAGNVVAVLAGDLWQSKVAGLRLADLREQCRRLCLRLYADRLAGLA